MQDGCFEIIARSMLPTFAGNVKVYPPIAKYHMIICAVI
jgi:hypothetical protein